METVITNIVYFKDLCGQINAMQAKILIHIYKNYIKPNKAEETLDNFKSKILNKNRSDSTVDDTVDDEAICNYRIWIKGRVRKCKNKCFEDTYRCSKHVNSDTNELQPQDLESDTDDLV